MSLSRPSFSRFVVLVSDLSSDFLSFERGCMAARILVERASRFLYRSEIALFFLRGFLPSEAHPKLSSSKHPTSLPTFLGCHFL